MTERPIRVGVQLAPQHATFAQLRDATLRAEDLGVDLVVGWDHFFPLTGDPDGAHFEGWMLLAALAEATTRVELGPLVSSAPFRNPDLVADMARTIDHVSAGSSGRGRFVLGLGSGWFERDFTEYGFEFGTAGSRLDVLAEALPRIRSRWDALTPAPTRSIPILIGGSGERKTLRLVAQYADIWHTFVPPAELPHKLDVLRAWCEDAGRDVGEIEISSGTSVRSLGSLDRGVLDEQLALGVTTFIAAVDGPDYDLGPIAGLLEWRDRLE
jgi:probable F420-dependent oxidoreductase